MTKKGLTPVFGLILMIGGGTVQAASNSNAVFIGGTPIMRVRVAAAGCSPDQRAAAIQERLNQILAHGPIHPSDISVHLLGAEAVLPGLTQAK